MPIYSWNYCSIWC